MSHTGSSLILTGRMLQGGIPKDGCCLPGTPNGDLSAAAPFCHKLALVKNGRLLVDGSPGKVLTPSLLKQAFDGAAMYGEIDAIPVVVAH